MDEQYLQEIVESCGAKMILRDNVSPKGDGSSLAQYVYARRGKTQRYLGKLDVVLAMSEEQIRVLLASKLGAGFNEEE